MPSGGGTIGGGGGGAAGRGGGGGSGVVVLEWWRWKIWRIRMLCENSHALGYNYSLLNSDIYLCSES